MFSLLIAAVLLFLPASGVDPDCEALLPLIQEARDNGDFPLLYERARETRECFSDLTDMGAQEAAYWEAHALRRMDRQDEALELYDNALSKLDVSADSSFTRQLYRVRGFVRYMSGRLSGAASDYSRVLDFSEDLPANERAPLALDAGDVFQRIGDMATARELYAQAQDYLEEADPSRSDYPEKWTDVMLAKADLHLQSNEPERALTLLESEYRHISDVLLQLRMQLYSNKGDALRMVGNTAEAQDFYTRYLDIAQRADESHHIFRAYELLGFSFYQLGEFDRAEEHFKVAETRMADARHDDYRRRLLERFGRLYEAQQDWGSAEVYYKRSVEVAEQYRSSLRASDWADASFDRQILAYHGLVRAHLHQGEPQRAFETLELARARHLYDLRMQSRLARGLDQDQQEKFDAITDDLAEARGALVTDTLSGREHTELSRRVSQLVEERSNLLELPPFEPPTTEQVQGAVEDDQVVLSYAIRALERDGETRPKVFAITRDTLLAKPIAASTDSLKSLLGKAHPAFVGSEPDFASVETEFSLSALHDLYEVLIGPVASYVNPDDHLTIIPDAPLYRLPFSALVSETPSSTNYGKAHYLFRDHPISQLTASSLLVDPPEEHDHDLDMAFYGQSDYGGGTAEVNIPGLGDVTLSDLPAVISESDALRSMFSKSAVFLNDDATTETFFAHAPLSNVVHIAAHTFVTDNSSVITFGTAQDESNGHTLHLHELRERPLSAELVVLSSCNTAIGSISQTDGMLGLQHAFSAAGARSTLSTLWATDDEATSRLMISFYEQLRDGHSKAEALQTAQLSFLKDAPAYATSPYFWAAPVIYGDVSPIEIEQDGTRMLWILGGGLLVLLFVIGLIVRRRYFSA